MRDYEQWHEAYDDPGSSLSWRLRLVSGCLDAALDRHPGPVRVLSACAGDGRDLFGVLAVRPDAARVRAVLVELHPEIAGRARLAAQGLHAEQGFVESEYAVFDPSAGGPAVGVVSYSGPPAPLVPGRQLFTFLR